MSGFFEAADATLHLLAISGSLTAAAVGLYTNNKLSKHKEQVLSEAKEMFPSRDAFDAHERQDAQRFEQMQKMSERRHEELRDDISRVDERVDKLILRQS